MKQKPVSETPHLTEAIFVYNSTAQTIYIDAELDDGEIIKLQLESAKQVELRIHPRTIAYIKTRLQPPE